MKGQTIRVAVGVILNARDEVLVTLRHADSHQGNLWEFPGGKFEPGESAREALQRELQEELGIVVRRCHPLRKIHHHYVDKSVLLDVWLVEEFSGHPRSLEGQAMEWRDRSQLHGPDFPAANAGIISTLALPTEIPITPVCSDCEDLEAYLSHLGTLGLQRALLNQPQLDCDTYALWYKHCWRWGERHGVALYVTEHPAQSNFQGCAGYHAEGAGLRRFDSRPVPAGLSFSATCHNLDELQQAERLQADFVYLSPVCYTNKYGSDKELGWSSFQALADQVSVPVYGLGGLGRSDLKQARQRGAFGIAGISAYLP